MKNKILILMRHGTAEDLDSSDRTDFDRELTKKGKDEIKHISKILKKHLKIEVQYIISSSAKRTIKTAKIVAKVFDIEGDNIFHTPELYNEKGSVTKNYFTYLYKALNTYDTILIS
jgi:phosphohistidine phosphatase